MTDENQATPHGSAGASPEIAAANGTGSTPTHPAEQPATPPAPALSTPPSSLPASSQPTVSDPETTGRIPGIGSSTPAADSSPAPGAESADGGSPWSRWGVAPATGATPAAGNNPDPHTGQTPPVTGSTGSHPGYGGYLTSGTPTGATPTGSVPSTGYSGFRDTRFDTPRVDQSGYPGQPYTPYGQPAPGTGSTTATTEKHTGRTVGIVAAAVVLALGAGFGGGFWASNINKDSGAASNSLTSTVTNAQPASSGSASADGVQAAAAKMLPSVVSILSVSSSAVAEGSGVILSAEGLILTNNHVVAGSTQLKVQFNDGSTATAKIVGTDATDDLAVIKVDGVSGLTPAPLGSSANLQVGEAVLAIGTPAQLSSTVTSGIVSALNRPIHTGSESQGQGQGSQDQTQATADTVLNAIQTDAAINPGNSGGPLVNMAGQVIGINSAIYSPTSDSSQAGSVGIGFAIPIDQARRIAQEIIDTGSATHAVFGASVATTASSADDLLTSGAKIAAVTAGGGAEKAGLQVGDLVTKVGDENVESAYGLIALIRAQAPNSQVPITYVRGSDTKTVTVTLGSAASK
jgi:putative serine protease PepD